MSYATSESGAHGPVDDAGTGLTVTTLGAFSARLGHAPPLTTLGAKMVALLIYLALTPNTRHERATLAELLWPQLDGTAARSNLRYTFFHLRKLLGERHGHSPFLEAGRDWLGLATDAPIHVDALAFSRGAPSCVATPHPAHCVPCIEQMEYMAGLYRGAFMAGFSLPDCQDFEDWLQFQRDNYQQRALTLLERLSNCHAQFGHHQQALIFAQRFVELEPWNEAGQRRAIRLLALCGQTASALAQYEHCCRVLDKELGVPPEAETRKLFDAIKNGDLEPASGPAQIPPPLPTFAPLQVARRQLTVLCCEITARPLEDPEDALEAMIATMAQCTHVLQSHHGFVVTSGGSTLLAYFGYPRAIENAARLAVQTALKLAGDNTLPPALLEVRLGVHTGQVVHTPDSTVPDPLGTTTGIALQLPQWVGGGEVAISATTQRLVAGYFVTEQRGSSPLRGVPRPLEVFVAQQRSAAQCRLDAAAQLSPWVGRETELSRLLTLWEASCRGRRHAIVLRGEAGIGKSRLAARLKEHVPATAVLLLRCLPEFTNTPFHPLIGLIESRLGLQPDAPATAKFARLAERIDTDGSHTAKLGVSLLAKLLSLPVAPPYREAAGAPDYLREKTLTIVLELLHRLTHEGPILLILEDAHWIDASTLELLGRFIQQTRQEPALAIITARPEFQPPWDSQSIDILELQPLPPEAIETLVRGMAGELTPAHIDNIVARADGIPLFAEELAWRLGNEGHADIPATLHDLLTARIEEIGTAGQTAQLAATLGRDFDPALLAHISPLARDAFEPTLELLRNTGLVRECPDGMFQFKHALIREAAYTSQAKAARQRAHQVIAEALQSDFATHVEHQPERLAWHWAKAGRPRIAIDYWLKAGRQAAMQSAHQEAVEHFRAGLKLIDTLPNGPARDRLELELQVGLGASLAARQGYGSLEAAQAYDRALVLCATETDGPEMFRVLWGLWGSSSSRYGFPLSLELTDRMMRLAERSKDPLQLQQVHYAKGNALFWVGEFALARTHSERAVALYRPEHHDALIAEYGENTCVASGSHLAMTLWFLGLPEQARRVSDKTVALARRLAHPFSLGYACCLAAVLHRWMRQEHEALALAEETLAVADSHGFGIWQAGGLLIKGSVLALDARDDGISMTEHAMAAIKTAMGGVAVALLVPACTARVHLKQFVPALRMAEEALALGSALGDHHADAELYRLKGECLLGLDMPNLHDATACFEQAIAISHQQHARSLTLRATLSLARLKCRQGDSDAAHALLEPVLASFTEGLATPDLIDARGLCKALAQPTTVLSPIRTKCC